MRKDDAPREFEKYSVWLKVNRQIEGPLFIISSAYIIGYTVLLILWMLRPELLNQFLLYICIGFFFFVFAIYIAFTGLLLKGIK